MCTLKIGIMLFACIRLYLRENKLLLTKNVFLLSTGEWYVSMICLTAWDVLQISVQ